MATAPRTTTRSIDYDVGCNSIRDGVNSDEPGATVGWLGFYTASTSDIESRLGYVRGYPGRRNLRHARCGVQRPGLGRHLVGEREQRDLEHDRAPGRHQPRGRADPRFYHYADPSCSGCGYGPYLVGMHRAGSHQLQPGAAVRLDRVFVHAGLQQRLLIARASSSACIGARGFVPFSVQPALCCRRRTGRTGRRRVAPRPPNIHPEDARCRISLPDGRTQARRAL